MFSKKVFILTILFLLIVIFNALFIVKQTEQALVLQFGDPIRVIKEPGLKFKIPFIQDAIFFDRRMLNLDPQPEEMILSDQKRIIVDSFARYKIVDPLKFFQTVRNETNFSDRFGRILNAAVRGVIAQYPLMALLSNERETIMSIIESKVIMEEEKFGIKILDVRIGRTDLTEQVANNVFQRMRSEREKEANLLRAEGEELSTEIRARANRQKTVIIAEAERTSSILRGQGDAQKNTILGNAYEIDNEQSIEFFNIIRKLQACRDTFGNTNMTMVIAPGQICDKFFGENKQD